jgi:hypothetical protein
MVTCRVDETLERVRVGDFAFPLGAYPVEAMEPRPGYSVLFEPADGDNDGEWEEWPDRYVFDIVISAERVESLVRHLMSLLPGRIFPILDVLGRDAYREVDPYVSYELLGLDRLTDVVRRFPAFFFEDGLVGFGAMSDDPFMYLFVDEHKIITLRCPVDRRESVERVLAAFDLEEMDEPAGADAALHEHRSVLVTPEGDAQVLGFDEILEELRDEWRLVLNVDPESNVDDRGKDLGVTAWRMLARADYPEEPMVRYIEVLLRASCMAEAEELGRDGADELFDDDASEHELATIVELDRVLESDLAAMVRSAGGEGVGTPGEPGVVLARWAG